MPKKHQPQVPARFGIGGGTDQSGSLALVLPDVWATGRCPIVDTWWQTETGGILISPLPGAHASSREAPRGHFSGMEPVVRRDDGTECRAERGRQALHRQALAGDHAHDLGRPRPLHRHLFPDLSRQLFHRRRLPARQGRRLLAHGPRRRRVNISGHRIGTAEVESALVSNPKVAEAAVVGYPHDIKGQGIYAYVTLKKAWCRARICTRNWCSCPEGNRADRPAGHDPIRRACRKPARARSCGASCARSPRTSTAIWATSRRWPIRRWSRTLSRIG